MKTRILMTVAALLSMGSIYAQDANSGGCAPSSGDPGSQPPCPPACCQEAQLNIETITVAAANGDPLAQYTLAYLTESGQGVAQDAEKAKTMYAGALTGLQQAAEAGDPRACKALAHMYSEGQGVDKDPAKAAEYMKMAKACKSAKDCKGCCKDKKQKDAKGCCKDKKPCKHGKKHHQAAPSACCTAADAPGDSAMEVAEVVETEEVTVVGEAPTPAPDAAPAPASSEAPAAAPESQAPSPEAAPAN